MTFATIVRRARGIRTQVEFARWLGVHHVTVCRWECNRTKPSPLAVRLFRILMQKSSDRTTEVE